MLVDLVPLVIGYPSMNVKTTRTVHFLSVVLTTRRKKFRTRVPSNTRIYSDAAEVVRLGHGTTWFIVNGSNMCVSNDDIA